MFLQSSGSLQQRINLLLRGLPWGRGVCIGFKIWIVAQGGHKIALKFLRYITKYLLFLQASRIEASACSYEEFILK
jgi:hypothetical protein